MRKINLLHVRKLFSFIGVIFSLLFFSFSAQGQVTVTSGCGITANTTPFAGTSSIFQVNLSIPGTYYCGDIMLYYNGTQLKCNEISYSGPMNCQGHNGGFNYNNNNVANNITLFLDTRKTPFVLSSTAPNDNSVDIKQTPANLVTPGTSVTFTVEAVLLDGSTVTGYKWFRNGVEIIGQTAATLSEVPPANGTRYSVKIETTGGSLQSEEKTVLFTTAEDWRFTMSGGASAVIVALDECHSIYEVDITITGDPYYSQFSLSENGTQLTPSTLSFNGISGVSQWNGNNLVYNGGPSGIRIKCYLNTRNGKPYELTGFKPFFDPDYLEVKLTADKNFINKGESVQLTAEVCPAGSYTYEWYENDVLMVGKSGSVITVNPDKNGNDYKVIVNGVASNAELILFADACGNRFSINQWYGSASVQEACAIDECGAVFRIQLHATNDAHFVLRLDGTPVDAVVDWDVQGIAAERGSDGTPAYRKRNGSGTVTFYLDLRDKFINIISAAKPDRNKKFVLATAVGGSQIAKCMPITIESCPNEPYFTYQWYKNGLPFANTPTLNDANPSAGDEYYLVVNEGTAEEITSNTIVISYQSVPKLPGTTTLTGYSEKLNWYEHSVNAGESITFTVSPADPAIATYSLQYKSLAVGSRWRDTTITPAVGANVVFTFAPEFGAKYRIKGVDASGCNEYHSDSSLVRFIYACTGGDSWNLFSEDFGRFQSGTYYYGNNQSTTTNVHSLAYPAGSYWAADPTGRVQGHSFAWSQGGIYNWCPQNGGRRIEDGYYAIVNNPASGDCGNYDYWNGPDHTGNANGGMLFINVVPNGMGKVVYEQEIKIEGGCKDVKVLFSAFISNATIKGTTPVDVRLDILNGTKTKTLYSISSGEVITRSQADVNAGKAWANLSFKFEAEESATYYMQLTNNAPGGSGNDILIDDISVTICVPKIEIELTDPNVIDFGNATDIGVCDDNVIVPLKAELTAGSGNIYDLFPNPIYQFQYSRNNGATWTNFPTSGNTIDIHLLHSANLFRGRTQWRIIVAGSQSTIDKVGNGTITEPSCSDMFLRSNIIIVDFDHRHYDDVNINECAGQIYQFTAEIPTNGRYEWYDADDMSTPLRSGAWTAANQNVTIPIATPLSSIPKEYMFHAISPYDCIFDYKVTITGRDCDDLLLTKTASHAVIDAGATLTYTLTLENKSKFAMENVIVNDKLPALMSYRSHVASAGTYTAATGDWNIGAMAVGDKVTLTITVQNTGGADSHIVNYAFVKKRTKKTTPEETVEYATYAEAKAAKPSFADEASVYVNPGQESVIIGKQPCNDDEIYTYSLNPSLIQPPITNNVKYEWSILPPNQGTSIQGATSNETFDVKFYSAPAEYTIQCIVYPDYVLMPNVYSTQTKKIYVTEVPNITISGKMHVCYGDIEKYTVLTDNTPNASYSWTLNSGENQLIRNGANTQTATVEWFRNDGKDITYDELLVTATNTSVWASCVNSSNLPVFIHANPPAEFRYENNNMMYFQSEPSFRHTDSVYTDMPIDFINESHTLGRVNGVQYYWDFAGDGVFTQASYDAYYTYHDVGKYTVQLHAVDTIWGCRTQIDKPLIVLPNPNCIATFPNAFTPAKTTNNVFGALYTNGVLVEGFELRVFNRWGEMMWSTNDPCEYWDGMYRGEMGKQDVYVYHCKALCQDIDPKTGKRKTLSIKGDVTLIR
ncbi:MAG: gliding motility-associated C-terminal domain-containing protein [Bacteroidetes bacterium]|nr:gliding motility-associated C-terminal domain-containing protein [Bacteroidota bacterium]